MKWALRRVLFTLLCGASAAPRAQEPVSVRLPPVLAADARVDEAVRRECSVEATVGNYVFGGIRRRYPGPLQVAHQEESRELRLTILSVMDGSNVVIVRADVFRQGAVERSSVFTQEARGVGVRGACSILAHVATALGGHIAAWLSGER